MQLLISCSVYHIYTIRFKPIVGHYHLYIQREQRKDKRKAKALKRKQEVLSAVNPASKTKSKKPRKEKISTNEDFEKHVHIAVDLSFNDYMTNLDMSKLRKQIAWCYKENRRSTTPVQVLILSI